jgi:membrane-associated phospholipid phosphatase
MQGRHKVVRRCVGKFMSIKSKLRKTGRRVTKADAEIVRAAAPRRGGGPEKVITTVGKLGDQPELRTLSAIVIAGGLLRANRRLFRTGIRMLLAHELATLGKNLIKDQIDRTRPHSAKSHRDRAIRPGRNTAKSETSFPSGHSAGAVAVARAFGGQYPAQAAPALAGAAVVAAMQVPRLNHYPTDVAAGMGLGVVSEAIAAAVLPEFDDESKPEAQPRPPRRA